MKQSEYLRMAKQEGSYWWHLGRLRIIEIYLKKVVEGKSGIHILNVGCGTGSTVPMLERHGEVDNVDTSEHAIFFMRHRGYSCVRKTDGVSLPYLDSSFEVVCALDVLEHIEADVAALVEWSRVLKADGTVILTVPAYRWLWSGHDVALGHYRRYTRKRLRSAALAAGLEVEKASYAIVFSLPLITGVRLTRRIVMVPAAAASSYVNLPKWVNWAFTRILYFEARLHRHLTFPAGSTVIAILRKPESVLK